MGKNWVLSRWMISGDVSVFRVFCGWEVADVMLWRGEGTGGKWHIVCVRGEMCVCECVR